MKLPLMFRNKLVVACVAFALISCGRNGSEQALKIDSLQRVIDSMHTQGSIPPPPPPPTTPAQRDIESIDSPKVESDASSSVDVWQRLRDNEDKYIGTKVKWKVKIEVIPAYDYGPTWAWLEGMMEYPCNLTTKDGMWGAGYSLGPEQDGFPKLHVNDWITIEGKFAGVSKDGEVEIHCSKITRANRAAN